MFCRVLQRLLTAGEYEEFEDVVTAEGEFIEADDHHVSIRQVILGTTSLSLMMACRHIVNYKLHPEVYYQTDLDPDLDGLELCSVWPLCVIRMAFSTRKYELKINVQGKTRYYQMTNTHTNGNLEENWARWQDRVIYLREDPYGYIRNMRDEYNLPFPAYSAKHHEEKTIQPVTDVFAEDSSKHKRKRRKRKKPREKTE